MASEIEVTRARSKAYRGLIAHLVALLPALIHLACTPGEFQAGHSRAGLSNSINPDKEITIRDLRVIEDSTRSLDPCVLGQEPLPPWSFGKIMQNVAEQAGAADASAFVKDWLDTWTQEQEVNGHLLEPRPIDQFVTVPWLAVSGGERLDLGRAPFRLMSIVNRIDLSQQDGKGEFRMEYVATNTFCEPIHFWIIFEFELPVESTDDLRALAQRWHALGRFQFGEEYNAALESLTDELSSARLKHVNAVEEEASVFEWNYRSFAIAWGSLVNVPLFQSPDVLDEGNPALTSWVNANQSDILADRHVVPDDLLGGDTRNIDWVGVGFEDPIEVRHHFALATCSGCHNGETGTAFVHTNRRRQGEATVLSPYMTGEVIVDPGGQVRRFNEHKRRAAVMQYLLQ